MQSTAQPLSSVTVVGAGYMGMGIAQALALAGAEVTVLDRSVEAGHAAVAHGLRHVEGYEERGLAAPGAAARVAVAVRAGEDFEESVADADLVVEAVFEDLAVKREVLTRVADATDAIIGSNTSSIPIGRLAEGLRLPGRMLGVHWFNPAMFVPGIEVIPTPETDPVVVERVMTLLRGAGKAPVVVGDSPGFVANRLQFALFREAALMVDEGVADAAQIDEVVSTTFGYRLPFFGPFAIADMAGLDVYAGAYTTLSEAYGDRFSAPTSLVELVAEGRTGVKSGRGGYTDPTPAEQERRVERRDGWYHALGALTQADD